MALVVQNVNITGEVNMFVINAQNVNDALQQGIEIMSGRGIPIPSRAGMTLEIPSPVTTVYSKPWERVLINSIRDANPFFHLMEAIWIIAGRDDVKFLTEFNKRMGDYSDNGLIFNAAYGYRLRSEFSDVNTWPMDQLQSVIRILKSDPLSRQAVCQIWSVKDLEKDTKDKACNMQIVFRVRYGKLCMAVYNRSNDMIWGAYGANVVQFSMIQEYVAAHVGIPMGDYHQVSNSFHVYTEGVGGEVWDRLVNGFQFEENPYKDIHSMVRMTNKDMPDFEYDLRQLFNIYDEFGIKGIGEMTNWKSIYFRELVIPMLCCHIVYKSKGKDVALQYMDNIVADDWRTACRDWLMNRNK